MSSARMPASPGGTPAFSKACEIKARRRSADTRGVGSGLFMRGARRLNETRRAAIASGGGDPVKAYTIRLRSGNVVSPPIGRARVHDLELNRMPFPRASKALSRFTVLD